jgi:exosortase A-associated hydrolase 2
MTAPFEPRFLTVDDTPLGQRLVIHHPPAGGTPKALVVYVHPFAEEMNKARRMAAMQARALAADGLAVLQIDLLGCGDSAGDFGDATWARWVDDVVAAARWLLQQRPPTAAGAAPPLWIWGLRAGTLLAAAAAERLAETGTPSHLLFWHPTPAGKLLLQQFLRLKAAGELLAGQAKAAMDQLRTELTAGRAVEVAGYLLHPALCLGLEQATLQPPAALPPGQLVWLEVSPVEQPTLAPAGAGALAAWRAAGWAVQAQALRGPAFWQTTEIEDAPALIDATRAALAEALTAIGRAAPQPAEATAA